MGQRSARWTTEVLAAVADLHRTAAESIDALSDPAVPWSRRCGRAGDVESSSARRADRPGRVRRGLPGLGYAARSRGRAEAPAGRSPRRIAQRPQSSTKAIARRVRHPNVVSIYGAEQIADQIGLWMEFVRGHTRAILDQRKVVSAEAVDIGLELCRAVSAVHGAGLLHRISRRTT